MLTKAQILDLCVAFDCSQQEITWAEEKGERLIRIHGIDNVESYLDRISHKLCLRGRHEASDKLLLIKYAIKEKHFSSALNLMA